MEAPLLVEPFLELLEKSELMTPARYSAAVKSLGLHDQPSARDAAKLLVSHRLLTHFQAVRLLEGRYRGFFVDHYKLLELLGAGGMGYVYAVEDLQTGRRFAMKTLGEEFRHDAGMLVRMRLEARAGARLDHPHIVKTYALGDDGVLGTPYLLMELVEGISLPERVVQSGPCPWPQACDFIRQVAEGLHHAHNAGIVHRDVKPANVLIDRTGRVKLLDFGLARLQGEEENEFSLTMIFGQDCIGTPDYMAPEQTLDSTKVDARADLYSLGLTLYSALTGIFPFPAGARSTVLAAQRTEEPRPIHDRVPGVPEEVVAIFRKLTAKRPEDRYQSALEVIQALEPFAKGGPIEFRFQEILAKRAREARRRASIVKERKSRARTSTIATNAAETSPLSDPTFDAVIESSGVGVARGASSAARSASSGMTDVNAAAEEIHSTNVAASVRAGDRLVPESGGPAIALSKPRMVMGRSASCDVIVSAPGVSGRHCELRFEGSWWRVTDLGSKNGIRVNGAVVTGRVLWPGDRLTIGGKSTFRLETAETETVSSSTSRVGWLAVLGAGIAAAAGAVWWLWM